jgi:catechol 2,3-dioxygenase-like lactoylglutathione lyase family enzyme
MNPLFIDHQIVTQVRIARHSKDLTKIHEFYVDCLGLKVVTSFSDHAGYSGIVLSLPDPRYHLEFTTSTAKTEMPSPNGGDLLVFYIPDESSVTSLVTKLGQFGNLPIEPENPYWVGKSFTFLDPDGWRIVLCNTPGVQLHNYTTKVQNNIT